MPDPDFKHKIETIKERTDIIEIVSEHIELDRHNKACCPFHNDTNPRFSVNPVGQYFYCFGCCVGGDVFRFLELFENKSFFEVLLDLAEKAGLSISDNDPEDRKNIEDSRRIDEILNETARYYYRNLTNEARNYLLNDRGFTEDSISKFQIGFAADGLREFLINERRFPMELCVKSGVLKKDDSGIIRDYFYNRIIFPTLNRGRVTFLTGRRLDGREPKYLHLSREISCLYNEEALYNKTVYLTEGIPDCISATQLGYPTVAILGSSNFKPEYLPKFSRCERINICLDGDDAGISGALKIAEAMGERARIVELPAGTDLNEYLLTHSKDDFELLISSAKDLIRFEIDRIPPDVEKTELPILLDPVFKKLAYLDKAKAEPYLKYEIKSRFGLTNSDIDGYRLLVNQYRKEEERQTKISTADSKKNYTASFAGLIDLVEQNGEPAFLVKENVELLILSEYEQNGIIYSPPPKDQIPWLLPSGSEVQNYFDMRKDISQNVADSVLYDELIAYHQSISELPGEEYYDLIVAWDLHTYLSESTQYSPIICLFAVPERGKSRTGKGMINVAHRGIHVESLRDAYLVRVANDLKASLFFDVKDIWRKAEKNGSEDILLHRFEKGAKVPRVLYPEKGAHKDIVYYSIFGPTIIGTNEGVHKILESRAVQINMPETDKIFENDVTPEFSLPFKEKLIAFRAAHFGEPFQQIPKPAPSRLGDILKPLHQVIRKVKPEREKAFLRLVKDLQADRMVEKSDSFEAQILEAVWQSADLVESARLSVKAITDTFNDGKSDREKSNPRTIGRRLNAMGFKKRRMNDGKMAIMWDDQFIQRLRHTYGMDITSETSESSKSMLFNDFGSEVCSEDSDIVQGNLQ